ncbi:PAS domain-containing hybrid sensor histidine kinase/response regulator [Pseudomonas sp. CFBP 8772]|uniref:PAS domain-containing hybrid sensor histidine kinase/response regulator n=1 Tax=Pseudomonas sp. CFBP 8772 TaxID=2775284 RepID=UPI00177ECC0C|nr:PAS domain S-box protein [Pseudomonas sp. CFBP 8772]MBD8598990.1 PAS domain S-box protein [Pseudomonas sp. CFBP 8772]
MSEIELTLLSRQALEAKARQLQAQLRSQDEEHARAKAVFDSAIEFAIITTDRSGIITAWNLGAEQVMGWTSSEVCGHDASCFFTPEDRASGLPGYEMATTLRDGRASDERWHLGKGERRFWASGEMMVLRGQDEEHIGFVKIFRDRTAEHLAGIVLKQTERLLRQAQEAGGVGLFSIDLASDVLWGTPEFFRIYGLAPSDSYPVAEIEALTTLGHGHFDLAIGGRLKSDYRADIDYCIRRPDTGALRWINRIGKMEADEHGNWVRFSGSARDITEQRKAEGARIASEIRYKTLFNIIDDGFCVIEFLDGPHGSLSDYIHVEANAGYQRQTGITGIVGQTIRNLAPAEADGWVELYREVLETGRTIRFERFFAAAGRDIAVSAARIDPGSRRQVLLLFRDITARKKAERVAQANVERVQLALAANAIIGTWVWDVPTDRLTVDESFAKAFGLDPVLGREGISFTQIIENVHPDDRDNLVAVTQEVLKRGGSYAYQYRTRRADGRYYWLEANGHCNLGADGAPTTFPGVLIDKEDRRALEAERDNATAALRLLANTLEERVAERTEELLRSEEQLRQSQKMEAVGQLTGGIAHDFNNLLAGILGSLELMSLRVDEGRLAHVHKYLAAALSATKRAAALTQRLLAFSRRQILAPITINVNDLLCDLKELLQRTVGPNYQIKVNTAPGLWLALVDPSQLENALLNLCINARDAMPEGGTIFIETANREIDKKAALRQDMPQGCYLALSVSDTGTGMPPEVIAKAFDPFFTTKPAGKGTGLGLSMIYGFAKQSNGQVRIHSVVGQGSTVTIYLPQHQGEVCSPSVLSAPTLTSHAREGETVLVVEDEPTVRLMVTEVLEEMGYIVIEATDAAGGLRVLQSNARLDLLISDIGLSGQINGRQLASTGRLTRPGLKVLFITGYAENALLENGQLEAGMSVLAKPFSVNILANSIQEMLAR